MLPGRTKLSHGCAISALLVAVWLPASAPAAWNQPVGGASPINNESNKDAVEPTIVDAGGVPYVAWREADSMNFEVRVRRLNAAGTTWEEPWASATSGGVNVDGSTGSVVDQALASIGGVPHVAFAESDGLNPEVRVSRLNSTGTAWEQLVGGASPINQANNQSALMPVLASIGGSPYVAWSETDGTNFEIRVSRLNATGTAWEQGPPWTGVSATSGGINQATNRDAFEPRLTSVGGVPYVAWSETDGTNTEIRVARLNAAGTGWEQPWTGVSATSGGINQASDRNAEEPSLTAIGGVPYVAWYETDGSNFEIRVSRLNAAGTGWEQPWTGVSATSGGVNQATDRSGFDPSLIEIGGMPYVAWREFDGTNNEMRVSRLNAAGTAWQQIVGGSSPINQANNRSAAETSLAAIAGIPYVAWPENDNTNEELRVSRLEPEFSAEAAVPSANGATLTADVHTYGFSYPVGFQYGTALESETSAEPTPAGVENATVTRQVDGLTPSTDYQFRPLATAGVPEPRVVGATGSFTTLPAPRDTAGPNLELSGKRKQDLSKKVTLTAECTDEPCELDATGRLRLPSGKGGKRSLKAVKLRPASADVDAGELRKLSLKLKKRSFKVAKRALDGDDKGTAKLRVTAADAAGNESRASRKVKILG